MNDETGTEYDVLPNSIKQFLTFKEWMWLTDAQKANLVRGETEPEWNEP